MNSHQILAQLEQKDNLINEVQDTPNIQKIPAEVSLYQALDDLGMLRKPFGLNHLIKEGDIGLSLDDGQPIFLAPGRHALFSPFHEFKGRASIRDNKISLASIEIVTIDKGSLGLCTENGINHILEAGRYILHAPVQYIESVKLNQGYVKLGTQHRLSVPTGFIAIASDNGKQVIITPEDMKKGPFVIDSDTFVFDPKKDFKSVQLEEIQLEELSVNTHEMISLKVKGLIRYKITDAHKAFLEVDNVHHSIKLQAEATLTSAFAKLSLDQIGNSLASTSVSSLKETGKVFPTSDISDDFIHQATELFIQDFKSVVKQWGVDLENLNILSINFSDQSFLDTLRERAKMHMQATTNLANLSMNNEVKLKEAERDNQQKIMEAEALAQTTKIIADAGLYEAKKKAEAASILAKEPLGRELALLDKQVEMARALGNRTTFMPVNMSLAANPSLMFAQPSIIESEKVEQEEKVVSLMALK